VPQNKDQFRVFEVDPEPSFSLRKRHLLTSSTTVRFSRRTLFDGVN
jgi:hypothetical protein